MIIRTLYCLYAKNKRHFRRAFTFNFNMKKFFIQYCFKTNIPDLLHTMLQKLDVLMAVCTETACYAVCIDICSLACHKEMIKGPVSMIYYHFSEDSTQTRDYAEDFINVFPDAVVICENNKFSSTFLDTLLIN
ncbi:hypothetical protein [Urbanus proteus nucleopolyhedrovirus]|uniref:Uncharacterized protein n=1 Tax=Urbanus proteus nucleopolyhedrovirus TaxID=1675866 RepID=A0A162GTT8_9ABAC|nr:hypothetical protein [Urbanus proteus nucleopolyhedrovirus]AKR17294.1 hypothetical protein [Urbanus proteus nucleopolyhedrovirus]